MQEMFAFGQAEDIARIRSLLAREHGGLVPFERLDPVSQLVRSLLGSRTPDTVSERVFAGLRHRYATWSALSSAPPAEIEDVIAEVTFAGRKARTIGRVLRLIRAKSGSFDLGFLHDWTDRDALAWLEALPGVGPKTAAAVVNFSLFNRKAFVADTHVRRVLCRYGMLGTNAPAWRPNEIVLASDERWSALELTEFHALVKRHGQTTCRHRVPRCFPCPLAGTCRRLPFPKPRRRRRGHGTASSEPADRLL